MPPGIGLAGLDGELVMVRVLVDAADLEDTLETLAILPFPVNPELEHRGMETAILFPAYAGKLQQISQVMGTALRVETMPMLQAISR